MTAHLMSVLDRKQLLMFESASTSKGCVWYQPQKWSSLLASKLSPSSIMWLMTLSSSMTTLVSKPSAGSGSASETMMVLGSATSGRPTSSPITSTGLPPRLMPLSTPCCP